MKVIEKFNFSPFVPICHYDTFSDTYMVWITDLESGYGLAAFLATEDEKIAEQILQKTYDELYEETRKFRTPLWEVLNE